METVHSGRPAVGASFNLPGIGPVVVASNTDPSLVTLETARGASLRIGERVLADLLQHDPAAVGETGPGGSQD